MAKSRAEKSRTSLPAATPASASAQAESRRPVLTPKQQRFVDEYLIDVNATRAAIRAGYSEATAKEQASRLLTNVHVSDAIAAAMDARSERVQLRQDEVLEELRAIVRSNVKHFTVTDSGEILLAEGAPPDAFRAVSSIKHKIRSDEQGTTHEVELKLWDKNSGVDKAMRHLGMLGEKVQRSGRMTLVIEETDSDE